MSGSPLSRSPYRTLRRRPSRASLQPLIQAQVEGVAGARRPPGRPCGTRQRRFPHGRAAPRCCTHASMRRRARGSARRRTCCAAGQSRRPLILLGRPESQPATRCRPPLPAPARRGTAPAAQPDQRLRAQQRGDRPELSRSSTRHPDQSRSQRRALDGPRSSRLSGTPGSVRRHSPWPRVHRVV